MNTRFEDLIGKTITNIKCSDSVNEIDFDCSDGTHYLMCHQQDCCESVTIEDVVGKWDDLIGSPILRASEDINSDDPKSEAWGYSHTWTFYNIATIKGHVTIRWYGESNGYYSESVDFIRTK